MYSPEQLFGFLLKFFSMLNSIAYRSPSLQILVSIIYIRILVATGHMKLAPFSFKVAKQVRS